MTASAGRYAMVADGLGPNGTRKAACMLTRLHAWHDQTSANLLPNYARTPQKAIAGEAARRVTTMP